jgi:hypothetical protein
MNPFVTVMALKLFGQLIGSLKEGKLKVQQSRLKLQQQ